MGQEEAHGKANVVDGTRGASLLSLVRSAVVGTARTAIEKNMPTHAALYALSYPDYQQYFRSTVVFLYKNYKSALIVEL